MGGGGQRARNSPRGRASSGLPAGPSSSSSKDDVDVKALAADRDKIKALMRRDPRFISRLISQLDSQMHKMLHEKHERQKQIKEDQARMAKIDETIGHHITPQLVSGAGRSGAGGIKSLAPAAAAAAGHPAAASTRAPPLLCTPGAQPCLLCTPHLPQAGLRATPRCPPPPADGVARGLGAQAEHEAGSCGAAGQADE